MALKEFQRASQCPPSPLNDIVSVNLLRYANVLLLRANSACTSARGGLCAVVLSPQQARQLGDVGGLAQSKVAVLRVGQ
jgi:hypothetical protein